MPTTKSRNAQNMSNDETKNSSSKRSPVTRREDEMTNGKKGSSSMRKGRSASSNDKGNSR